MSLFWASLIGASLCISQQRFLIRIHRRRPTIISSPLSVTRSSLLLHSVHKAEDK
jgi:hypothetical protein